MITTYPLARNSSQCFTHHFNILAYLFQPRSCYETFVFKAVSLKRGSRVTANNSRDIISPL